MRSVLLPIAMLLSATAYSQVEMNSFSDEFSDSASLRQWSFFHMAEGFPNKIKTVEINRAKNGLLELKPKASGWYADNQAPFMYKMITGNFDVRARVKVSGEKDELPAVDWSLAGLMVRQPKRTTQSDWMPRQENWLFITTGVADDTRLPVLEMKTTNNSMSNLKLRPAKKGWIELRIVRIDAAFILLSRYEGEDWHVQERFYRPVMMGPLQVGLNAYSSWNAIPAPLKRDAKAFNETIADAPADLLLQVDYIRFSQPRFDVRPFLAARYNTQYEQTLFYTMGNLLTDYSISNQEIVKLIGN